METSNPSTPPAAPAGQKPAGKKRLWLRIVKWCVGIAVSLILLLMAAVGVAVWILTPERLTPLVEKYGSEFIDGKIEVERVELTYWKTFPRLQLDVDSLRVISHSLKGLSEEQRAALPAGADSLLNVAGFHGGINILELLRARIALYDIVIDRPAVNLVDAAPGVSNYNIFPTDEPADTTPVDIPDFRFSRFVIKGEAPLSYVSLPDSINCRITLSGIDVTGDDAPGYKLHVDAGASTRVRDIDLTNLRIGMGGDIIWDHKHPYKIELRDFQAGINKVMTVTSTIVDFEKDLTIESLDFAMPAVKLNEITALIPEEFRSEIDKVENNLEVSLKATLTKPYLPAGEKLPSLNAKLSIPEGSLAYEQLKLSKLAAEVAASIDGDDPAQSRVELSRLLAIGQGVGFELKGTATDIFADPLIDGTFKGGIEFQRLPAKLMAQTGCNVSGSLRADATFRLKQSWLSRENFHRINAAGSVNLSGFSFAMPMMDITAYIRKASMALGTTRKFVHDNIAADSLLTLSVSIDTIAAALPGMEAYGSAIRAGVGCRNTSASADTSQLNPIGAALSLGRFKFIDTSDSSRIRLRDVKARGSLRRFRDSRKQPLLNVGFDAKRMRYSDRLNRANLREATAQLTLHPSVARTGGGKRMAARIDSLRRLYPDLPEDSLRSMARRQRRSRQQQAEPEGSTRMDYGLDTETQSMMRRWRAEGSLTAKRARVFTPYFPLRNVLSDINLTFNNDSISISRTRYRVGRSDFMIDGTITNVTRAMTSRSGRQPLRINFRLTSDTVDVNQLAAAVFAGAAFAEKERQGAAIAIADSDDDNIIQQSIAAQADSTASGPLLIPTNVEATLRVNARNVIYSDFVFHNLRGSMEIFDGALNMRNLSARTDIGAVDITALYEGLDPSALNFAFGMNVRDFRVGRFLDLVPALDSIMPLLKDMDGIINGQIAAQAALEPTMDLRIPSLNAAVMLQGDSLVLLDKETFRSIGKWMLFKNKSRNVIDSMTVKLVVKDSKMQLYPFMFDIDRYRLGVYGNNDLDLNFKYHIAVLKSPIPFKFGINVSGNPDKMKIRLGGAKWDPKTATRTFAIADTTRINLVNQIQNLFRRGVRNSREPVNLLLDNSPAASMNRDITLGADTISHADSLIFIQQGLLPAPPAPADSATQTPAPKGKSRKKR